MVGAVKPLRDLLVGEDTPLFFINDASGIVGAAMIPSMMLTLGATLYKGPGAGKVPARVIIVLSISRLVLSPLIGAGVVYGLFKLGAFTVPDKMFLLVMFSLHMVPTAMNV